GEERPRQRRGGRLRGGGELTRAAGQQLAAGEELQHLRVRGGFGLDEHGRDSSPLDGPNEQRAQPATPTQRYPGQKPTIFLVCASTGAAMSRAFCAPAASTSSIWPGSASSPRMRAVTG